MVKTAQKPPVARAANDGERVVVDVALVAWPAEAEWLSRLRRMGQPRLLLIPSDTDPPVSGEDLEDWVRTPADPLEVHARVTTVLAVLMLLVGASVRLGGPL